MKVIRAMLYIILVSVIVVSGYFLEIKMNEYRIAEDIHTERTVEMRKGRDVDFEKLKEQNPDTKGWIWLPDTNIDYPIVQGEDNDYYLHRDFDRSYLYDGCIFIDSSVEEPFSTDYNTVIYGHRMSSGAMFHDLGKYSDKEFFDSHKTIIIETEDKSYDLHVVAFCTEDADSDLYTTWYENYEPEYDNALDQEVVDSGVMTKSQFIEFFESKAKNLTDETYDESDSYVTLSTCAYSTGDKRNQVIGILKETPKEEKIVKVATEKPLFNKWLLFQILVGAIVLFVVIAPLIPKKRR